MKTFFLSLLLLVSANFLFAQDYNNEGYSIKSLGTKYSKVEIEEAIEAASWCTYRYMNKRQVLNFKSGIVIELHSYTEMKNNNVVVDETCYMHSANTLTDQFIIHETTKKIVRLRSKYQKK